MVDLFDRQKKLNLKSYEKIGVIGAGGIGSWVALDLALATEGLKKMVVVDPDIIELHNLNRTPYTMYQIGKPKAEAIAELILERRPNLEVVPVTKTTDSNLAKEALEDVDIIIDCRDNLLPLPKRIASKVLAKLGYDGTSITIMINPDYRRNISATYQTVPSYLAPPQILAAMITHILLSPNLEKIVDNQEYYTTTTLDKIIEMIGIMKTKNGGVD